MVCACSGDSKSNKEQVFLVISSGVGASILGSKAPPKVDRLVPHHVNFSCKFEVVMPFCAMLGGCV